MKNLGRVSVIIPCYNYGVYVSDAIESVLAQDMPVELIVVDDGSDESSTLHTLNRWRSRGIQVLRQDNGGLSAARNAGIRVATGDYIVCLDADDLIQPTYCSACSRVLDKESDIGFVYSTTRVFGAENYYWSTGPCSALQLLIDNCVPCSAMFRRQIWEDIGGFAEELRTGYEDWDFWLGVLERGWKGLHIEGDLFWYRKHGQSMLHHSNQKRKELKRRLRQRHKGLYSFPSVLSMIKREPWAIPQVCTAWIKEEVLRPLYRV